MSSQRAVRTVINAVQKLYPRELADGSWDNTGLLLGAPLPDNEVQSPARLSVLLAIDLTQAVADEAISKNSSMIVAYHPIIFRGLKSITQQDTQQASLIKLARAGISVYCPHTACDAAIGGVNDWLLDGVTGGPANEIVRSVVQPVSPAVDGHESAGMGRVAELKKPIPLNQIIQMTKTHLELTHIQAAISKRHSINVERHEGEDISSIAVCAGSGGSVLRGVKADLYITGELGHHEALALVENGISALVCGHSNTERGFLHRFKRSLEDLLKQNSEGFDYVEVQVSETDEDPMVTV